VESDPQRHGDRRTNRKRRSRSDFPIRKLRKIGDNRLLLLSDHDLVTVAQCSFAFNLYGSAASRHFHGRGAGRLDGVPVMMCRHRVIRALVHHCRSTLCRHHAHACHRRLDQQNKGEQHDRDSSHDVHFDPILCEKTQAFCWRRGDASHSGTLAGAPSCLGRRRSMQRPIVSISASRCRARRSARAT
jgi:hypothetical protein